MLPVILALLAPPADYAGPVRLPAVGPRAVLLRREVYEMPGRDGRPVRVGLEEWSESQNPRK